MLLGAALPAAQAAPLTSAQIGAITSLLTAFRVDSTTIATVQSTLSGGTTGVGATASSTGAVQGYMIGFLKKGDHGRAVCFLHALLAADPTVDSAITASDGDGDCPFGPLTERALKGFQGKHGIAMVGFIGPQTLAAINAALASTPLAVEDDDDDDTASSTPSGSVRVGKGRVCAIVPPGHFIAPGWLRKHGGVVPLVPACQTLPPGIAWRVGGTTGTSSTTLSISGVSAGSITNTGATIGWTTSLAASGKVEYGTTTAYGSSSSLVSTLSTSHSIALTGLDEDTTYHFRAISSAGSQTATSSDMTFTTDEEDDTTAPDITDISADDIATTTATISWTTDEPAKSKVYFSTDDPIDLDDADEESSSSLVTSHSLDLTDLTADTEYNYVVESEDSSGNVATSSSHSFTTTE